MASEAPGKSLTRYFTNWFLMDILDLLDAIIWVKRHPIQALLFGSLFLAFFGALVLDN